jgi:hypothetical protein
MNDDLWENVEKLIPEGRKPSREDVEIETADMINVPPPPPDLAAALDRFARASAAFSQMTGTGSVRAHAASEIANRADSCARVLRNWPRGAESERQAAANAFGSLSEHMRNIAKFLGRNDVEGANELVPELGSKFFMARQLTAIAVVAMTAPLTN